MTHQPPVPQAAQSPFPLQPKPHNDGAKLVATPAPAKPEPLLSPALAQLASIGAAFLGSAALATWYFRRDKKQAPAARKATARKSAPRKTSNSATPKPRKSSDPARVAAGQPYEVSYFARKHGLSTAEARAIIKEAGPSRAKSNQLVKDRKAEA
ncbi:DUF3606 domain-containing protein [Sphingomonas qilianensis]|uniref:DUF3606 domain-containing protein n=1 Tax=Sphingomonas qilianensis TaxID=1736690 RepID=A0ABU9XS75_9SPHN